MGEKIVGIIKNDAATFLQVTYSLDVKTGEIDLAVKKDTGLLNNANDKELKEILDYSVQRIHKIFEQQFQEEE